MRRTRSIGWAFAGLLLWLAGALAGILPAAATEWEVDGARSTLGFEAQVGGVPVPGRFSAWTAEIVFDPADPAAGAVSVRIDTASADTGDATRDGMLRGDDFFAVAQFPEAVFRSSAIRAAGPGRYEMEGVLTLRGASKALAIPFALAEQGDGSVRAEGEVVIDRRDFGIGRGEFAGDGLIAHPVTVRFTLFARPRG